MPYISLLRIFLFCWERSSLPVPCMRSCKTFRSHHCTCPVTTISTTFWSGQFREKWNGPGAGWLGAWWRPTLCHGADAARSACLCAVSQHFPPGEHTVYRLGCGGMFGWERWWANHRKWKWEGESDGAGARCFAIALVMKCHNGAL